MVVSDLVAPTKDSQLADWLAWQEVAHTRPVDLGLSRVGEVWRRMGSPLASVPKIVVAGTNGKGSSVAFLDALARAGGQHRGTFTSPHLLRYNERICVDGVPAADHSIVDAFREIDAKRGEISLSYFEFGCLAALKILDDAGVEVAFLEVGLGGRLDAVNIVDANVALITSIDLDHMRYLGPDRDAIFGEKAGIARAGRPLIVADPVPPASAAQIASATGATVLWRGKDFDAHDGYGAWTYRGPSVELNSLPNPALHGAHQIDNACGALAAWESFGGDMRPECVVDALESVRNPGRLQRLAESPGVIVDVGHNGAAARAIARWFEGCGRRISVLIVGMLEDKDPEAFLDPLLHFVDQVLGVPTTGPRGTGGDMIVSLAAQQGVSAQCVGSTAEALALARRGAASDGEILVCGSFQVAEAAVRALGRSETLPVRQ